MSIGKKIKNLRLQNGISQTELAERIKISKQTLYKYEKGIVTNIPSDKIEALADALNTTPSFLMGWEKEQSKPQNNIFNKYNNVHFIESKKVPLIGNIACGSPVLAAENIEDYIDMDKNIHADFALRCKDDSMINARILDGDIVYIQKQDNIENGEIAAVLIDECTSVSEATLKRVYIYEDKIRLCAENPQYKDRVFFENDINKVRILGKAVAFLSSVN